MTKLRLEDQLGEIHIQCLQGVPKDDHVELMIDSEDDHGLLIVQVRSPKSTVICERVVRSVPGSLRFRVPLPGRYEVQVRPLKGAGLAKCETLTWSDWNDMANGGTGGANARDVDRELACGDAVLLVA